MSTYENVMKSLPFSLHDEPQSWQTVLTNPMFQHISNKKEGLICCCDVPRDVVEQELVQLFEVKFGRWVRTQDFNFGRKENSAIATEKSCKHDYLGWIVSLCRASDRRMLSHSFGTCDFVAAKTKFCVTPLIFQAEQTKGNHNDNATLSILFSFFFSYCRVTMHMLLK